ncbi:hypothetical protein GQ457_14G023940 [Hibiscus cannabinus]
MDMLRLDISHKYAKDQSCVNSVSFNAVGNILVNGLADKRVTMWDWEAGIAKLSFKSGHGCIVHNFVAKIIPHTGDRHLITCSADGQVNGFLLLAKHTQRFLVLCKRLRNAARIETCTSV